jgi:FMN-dependent NADH-azoreductase
MTDKIATVLRVDSSARRAGSVTRELTDLVMETFEGAEVLTRDLAVTPVPQVDGEWVAANFTPAAERSPEAAARLELSDALIAELRASDVVVIGLPIYNFGLPAALKAWIDHVARAGETFRYTEAGPEGLLKGKRAIIVAASGGTNVDSAWDHATPYLRHALGFLGITDVEVIAADSLVVDPGRLDGARAQIGALAEAA